MQTDGHVRRKLRPDRRDQRRNEAKHRQARWDAMTPAQKIESLDRRLGEGQGAKSQREKLAKLVKLASHPADQPVGAATVTTKGENLPPAVVPQLSLAAPPQTAADAQDAQDATVYTGKVVKVLKDGSGVHSYLVAGADGKTGRLPVLNLMGTKHERKTRNLKCGDSVTVRVLRSDPNTGRILLAEHTTIATIAAMRAALRTVLPTPIPTVTLGQNAPTNLTSGDS